MTISDKTKGYQMKDGLKGFTVLELTLILIQLTFRIIDTQNSSYDFIIHKS